MADINMRDHKRTRTAVLAAATLTALLLAGCAGPAPGHGAAPAPTPRASQTPPTTSTPATSTRTPTPSPTPLPDTTPPLPIHAACNSVLTLDDVYAYNPNYVLDPHYSVGAYSVQARMIALGGVSCGWIDETSNDTFSVSVAAPTPPSLVSLTRAGDISGFDIPGYPRRAGEAYFNGDGQLGEVQAFTGRYWVVIESEDFLEPGDATLLVQLALENLR